MTDITSEKAEEQLYYWFFLCDSRTKNSNGRTEFEVVRNSLRNIHAEEPALFPENLKIIGESGVQCLSSESKMRSAAEYLRNQVHLPFCIYGYPYPESLKHSPKYLHTFGGKLYTRFEHGWKIDQVGAPKNSLGADESRVSSMIQPCSVSHPRPLVEMARPSKVNKEYVYFPSSKRAIDKMGDEKGGKWMLHSPGCMDIHDSYWLGLISLCRKGILTGMKASTAAENDSTRHEADPRSFPREDPVIMCYTADAGDIGQVGKAADAIRKVVECDYVLYYKTNDASRSGRYYHEGSKSVSMYMHTEEGELYARDKMRRWKLVNY